MDPPIPIKVEQILRNAFNEVRQLEFRIDVWRKYRDADIRGEEMVDAAAVADAIQSTLCGGDENIYFAYPSDRILTGRKKEEKKNFYFYFLKYFNFVPLVFFAFKDCH